MAKKLLNKVPSEVARRGARRIVRTPGYCGGKARFKDTRIPISTLEEYRKLGASTQQLLEMYPALTVIDLSSAWRYVERHRREIEAEIEQNRE